MARSLCCYPKSKRLSSLDRHPSWLDLPLLHRWVTQGTEKVILIQEQLSKNRIIIDIGGLHPLRGAVTFPTGLVY